MRSLTLPARLAVSIVLSALVAGGAMGYWLGISDRDYSLSSIQKSASQLSTAASGSGVATTAKATPISIDPTESHQERRRGNPVFATLLEDLTELAKTDSKKAFEETHKVTPESFRPLLRAALAKTLLKADFSRVGEILMLLDNRLDEQSVLFEVLPVALKRNQNQTLSAIRQQLSGTTLNNALRITVQTQLEQGNVNAAIETQLSMPFSDERDLAILNITDKIAAKGLDDALEWLKQLQPEGEQVQTRKRIQEFFVEKRDYPTLELLLGITGEAKEREMLIRVVALQFKSSGDPGAQAFMNSLPPQERDFVLMPHIINHPSASFEEKMQMALGLSGLQARSDTFREIVSKEVRRNPSEACVMALSLPDDVRLSAVYEVVGQWSRIDSEAVAGWVQQLPRSELREGAITRLARSLQYKDRSAAREVASWLEDQQKREVLVRSIAK